MAGLTKAGLSPEGKIVLAGCFTLVDTHGLPLSILLDELRERDSLIDWQDYILSAWKKGWSIRKTSSHITDAVQDVYSQEELQIFYKIFIPLYRRLVVLYFQDGVFHAL